MNEPQIIKLGKTEYVILPKAEYLKLQENSGIPAGSVDAIEFTRASIGAALRAAREHANLTQAELAEKLGKSQPMVSGAEGGSISISERYVRTVLKACKLPADWTAPKPKTSKPRAKK
ncbi:MAG TPA: helix-turn-helix transcriptional regulator [Polyangiaceae bacterium]|nr:helix-turn-helix transcriptional regulator [Polyangiaceae bacterium]